MRSVVRQRFWTLAAKVAALAILTLATLVPASMVIELAQRWPEDRDEAGLLVAMFLIGWLVTLGLSWVAWRLWRHWSAATVRLTIGAAVGLGAVLLLGQVLSLTGNLSFEARNAIASGVAMATLVGGAYLYRRLSRAVIRNAQLPDPWDMHGHPAGHMQRVAEFCGLLGFCVGWGVWNLTLLISQDDGVGGIIGLAAGVVTGFSVYKAVLWWMTPPTSPALPTGGFEVLRPTRHGGADHDGDHRAGDPRHAAERDGEDGGAV